MPASAADNLARGADTFRERNILYGNNYKRFGNVMRALFPDGLPVASVDEWNRLGILIQCVSKLTRYIENLDDGGHKDSAHDLMVYAAMLEELTGDG
jgi:hypothetical protein